MNPEAPTPDPSLSPQAWWISVAGAMIFALVRLLKSPACPAPLSKIPPRWRTLVAVVLGQLSGLVSVLVLPGADWKHAIFSGLASAGIAVLMHEGLIEGLLGGQEIGGSPAAALEAAAPSLAPAVVPVPPDSHVAVVVDAEPITLDPSRPAPPAIEPPTPPPPRAA